MLIVNVRSTSSSVLGPLLFIIVLKALSRKFGGGLPLKPVYYADDQASMADKEEIQFEKLKK